MLNIPIATSIEELVGNKYNILLLIMMARRWFSDVVVRQKLDSDTGLAKSYNCENKSHFLTFLTSRSLLFN